MVYVKDKIIELANEFCDKNNVTEYPVPIVDLCKKEGFSVYCSPLSHNAISAVVVRDEKINGTDSNMVIVASENLSARQVRFQTACELAAYLLYHDPQSKEYFHCTKDEKRKDRDVMLFARNILLPKDLVRKSLSALKKSVLTNDIPFFEAVYHIADNFAVPLTVADKRLKELGTLW